MNLAREIPNDVELAARKNLGTRCTSSLTGEARPVALLVAVSLNLTHRLALAQGWEQIAMHRYQTPEGNEVHAVADRPTGFVGRPTGTPIYLHPSWTQRDDWRDIDARMQRGDLVRVALPKPVQRR